MQLSIAPRHMGMKLLAPVLVLVAMAPSASAGRNGAHIAPKLDPKSDKVFFKKDYPHDLDPEGAEKVKFRHPYPAVQEHREFDKDYVKDENADAGEWKAQMEYDALRTKVSKEKDDVQKAKETQEKLRQEVEEAKQKEEAAAKAAKEAEKRVKDAKEAAAKTKEEAKQAGEEAKAKGENAAKEHETAAKEHEAEVDQAVDKVKKEMDDLKDCQQQLADARAELKRLVAKQEGNSTADEQGVAGAASAEEKAAKAAAAAELQIKEAAAVEAKEHAADAKLKREIAEEEAKYEDALHTYEKESAKMDEMENDLDAAAHRLRKFRKEDEPAKSGTIAPTIAAPLLLAAAALVGHLP
uniref:Uncharacterized protein n=1 Tax=Alexandrium andersonii TaxID=327968 RepID=A0A7S2J0N5_9DINO|mmetsp:Transcript_91689/g.205300  ORF Transcript_91689/g.205300 Transcript_91689/m.205300 type:complete len:353 (+) Transcript_91689:61-1119(+)